MLRSASGFALLSLLFSAQTGAAEFCGLRCEPDRSLLESLRSPGLFGAPPSIAQCGNRANIPVLTETPLAGGARRTMALAYGSCEVLKLKTRSNLIPDRISGTFKSFSGGADYNFNGVQIPAGVEQVRKTHPYLRALQKEDCSNSRECSPAGLKLPVQGVDPSCKKMVCDAWLWPSMYQYGGKAGTGEAVYHEVFTRKSYDSKTKKTTTRKYSVSGLDCSYFVFQAMQRAGLKFSASQQNFYRSTTYLSTLGARGAGGKREDCFDRINSAEGIRPGDLLVASGVHVAMVDTVGRDPFGIARMIEGEAAWNWSSPAQQSMFGEIRAGTSKVPAAAEHSFLNKLAGQLCADLDPARFRITIIHSSPNGNGVGIQREEAYSDTSYSVGLGRSSTLLGLLKLKAKAECILALKKKWESFSPGFSKSVNAVLEAIRKSERAPGGSKVLRHASIEPGCRGAPPIDPALNCADCCDLGSSYESLTGGSRAD